jgi:hypothetical protein
MYSVYTASFVSTYIFRAAECAANLIEHVNRSKLIPPDTRSWVKETFASEELPRTTMAFHILFFMAHWKATSGLENTFNIWKKFQGKTLKK